MMKDKVKEMYDQIVMPEEVQDRIHRAMVEKRTTKPNLMKKFGTAAATVAVMLALVLVISPQARAAVGNFVSKVILYEDTGLTLYEETDAEGNVSRVVEVNTESPTFVQIREGRAYFMADGQNTDITDEIAEDKPYYYTYTDDEGYIHYLAVGYSGTIENFGIYEFIREDKEGQKEWEGWATGTGRNFIDPETETAYPWVAIVWKDLNIPWPMPE